MASNDASGSQSAAPEGASNLTSPLVKTGPPRSFKGTGPPKVTGPPKGTGPPKRTPSGPATNVSDNLAKVISQVHDGVRVLRTAEKRKAGDPSQGREQEKRQRVEPSSREIRRPQCPPVVLLTSRHRHSAHPAPPSSPSARPAPPTTTNPTPDAAPSGSGRAQEPTDFQRGLAAYKGSVSSAIKHDRLPQELQDKIADVVSSRSLNFKKPRINDVKKLEERAQFHKDTLKGLQEGKSGKELHLAPKKNRNREPKELLAAKQAIDQGKNMITYAKAPEEAGEGWRVPCGASISSCVRGGYVKAGELVLVREKSGNALPGSSTQRRQWSGGQILTHWDCTTMNQRVRMRKGNRRAFDSTTVALAKDAQHLKGALLNDIKSAKFTETTRLHVVKKGSVELKNMIAEHAMLKNQRKERRQAVKRKAREERTRSSKARRVLSITAWRTEKRRELRKKKIEDRSDEDEEDDSISSEEDLVPTQREHRKEAEKEDDLDECIKILTSNSLKEHEDTMDVDKERELPDDHMEINKGVASPNPAGTNNMEVQPQASSSGMQATAPAASVNSGTNQSSLAAFVQQTLDNMNVESEQAAATN
ncbi:hypothetical protein QCA50_011963 [Cerrena zonata]|uniref:Uncharacterized protein n=1 Tax=Cerrena zonata TaxID=2478898 RepID=A0AAW0FHG5_9APHY